MSADNVHGGPGLSSKCQIFSWGFASRSNLTNNPFHICILIYNFDFFCMKKYTLRNKNVYNDVNKIPVV